MSAASSGVFGHEDADDADDVDPQPIRRLDPSTGALVPLSYSDPHRESHVCRFMCFSISCDLLCLFGFAVECRMPCGNRYELNVTRLSGRLVVVCSFGTSIIS